MVAFYVIEMQISLALAFGSEFYKEVVFGDIEKPFYILLFILLVIDIFLSFFKGFYAFGRGKVVDDKYQVAKKYLISQFPFDFVVAMFYLTPLYDGVR